MNLCRSVSFSIKVTALLSLCMAQSGVVHAAADARQSGEELVMLVEDTFHYIGHGSLFVHLKEITERASLLNTDPFNKKVSDVELHSFIVGIKNQLEKICFDDLAEAARLTEKQTKLAQDIFNFVSKHAKAIAALKPQEVKAYLKSKERELDTFIDKLYDAIEDDVAILQELNDSLCAYGCGFKDGEARTSGHETVSIFIDFAERVGEGTLFKHLKELACRALYLRKALNSYMSDQDRIDFIIGMKYALTNYSINDLIEAGRFTDKQAMYLKETYEFILKHVNNVEHLTASEEVKYRGEHRAEFQRFIDKISSFLYEELNLNALADNFINKK